MKKILFSAVILCIPTMSAYANNLSFFSQLDADSDSLVSRSEAELNQDLAEIFDVLDTDLDGLLSVEEYESLLQI